jgi:uridine kinase
MIIGIGGGTGSGKTTVAQKIVASIGEAGAVHVPQDAYYRDLADIPLELRHRVNFDHPDALDFELMRSHLESLREGKSIERPVYDFMTHTRKPETIRVAPLPAIIFEGVLALFDTRIRSLMDVSIFVDCDADIRLIRRLERDMRERGRTAESVIEQYRTSVRPMHAQFVAPSRKYAGIILTDCGFNKAGVDRIIGKIRSELALSSS